MWNTKKSKKIYFYLLIITSFGNLIFGKTYFVAPDGDDSNAGTIEKPFASMQKGHDIALAGDTIYIRGGKYLFSGKGARDDCGIYITKSGKSDKERIYFWAYKDEKPVFDFSELTLSAQATCAGIRINGSSWLHFKELEICNVPQPGRQANNGIWCNPGSNIIFEQCVFHHNSGPGLSIAYGNGGHLVLNCDSYCNYDANSNGEDADGFGVHYQSSGTSTIIRGCRAWWNADDGFDCIHQNIPVIVENSWFWLNGYKAGTTTPAGNGQGVKGGGYNLPPSRVPATLPQNIIRFCVSFLNKDAGFNTNYHPIACYWYNNTAFNNRTSNFKMQGITINGSDYTMTSRGILKNNISFKGTAISYGDGPEIISSNNSWDTPGLTVSADDFLSIDTTGVSGPRQPDGSLPDIPFLKLKPTSKLIDRGVDVGLPYSGKAPDLGAFEFNDLTKVEQKITNYKRDEVNTSLLPVSLLDFQSFDISGRRINNPDKKTFLLILKSGSSINTILSLRRK